MSNCLVLLTNYYPFHKGEEYLESEIEYLSEKFTDIYILSTMVSSKMEQTRIVPNNVIVLPVGISHSPLGKLKMVLNQSLKIYNNREKKQMIKNDTNGSGRLKLYCYYFESRAMEVYTQAKYLLNKYDFNSYESVTIYSYWLYVTARVAVELKNNYFEDKYPYTISRAHRYDLYEEAAPLGYLPEREYLLKSLDSIFPCSQDGVEALNETHPSYENKIQVERLGTISTNITSNNKKDKLYIVSCSVVRKVKRLNLLIEALHKLEEKNIPYEWTHIGNGPEFEKIKKIALKKLNMTNVNFKGFLKNEDVLNWYKDNPATVFVNLSSSEGVPVAIMEAISMGLPVIATDVGGTREIVDDNKNGYLLEKNCKVSQIVECLMKYYQMDEKDYNKLCENALYIWNKRCNAKILYSNFSERISSRTLS